MDKILVNEIEMERMLDRMAFQLIEACPDAEEICIVGIQRRGVPLSKRIGELVKKYTSVEPEYGTIDITLYRDDLDEIGDFPMVYGSDLPLNINRKTIVLVDDVVYTGRTVRAALEAIAEYGRPARIVFLALIDRGHRELPIQPDFIGKVIPTAKSESIRVNVMDIDGQNNVTIERRSE